jgi:4-diphosphocytidyl-2-C-methyl-D-erythritol kinase
MYVRHRNKLVEVHTPAKVNLFLEVLARRDDGFHEIETLMVPISLFDTLWFAADGAGRIGLSCRWAAGLEAQVSTQTAPQSATWGPLPANAENLVTRALERLRERAGIEAGAMVRLTKRIPSAAGLGGASSDAAAALVAANVGWGLGWSRDRLAAIAAEVGSDVPFFLHSAACVCRGRGERIEPVTSIRKLFLVVVRPPTGLSTPEVYRQCLPAERPQTVGSILAAAQCGDAAAVGRLLFNRLQVAAERLSSWIGRLREAFDRLDCLGHQMSGSGSSCYGICRHARHAQRVAGVLRSMGLGAVFSATTLTVALRPV